MAVKDPKPKRAAPKRASAKPETPEKEGKDWVAIMAHVRAGIRSYDDIGAEFGVSKGRISQKKKELNVVQDLAPQIRARAEAKVNRALLNKAKHNLNTPHKQEVESEVVEVAAVLMANTILAERSDVARLRALANGLVTELEGQAKKAAAKPGETAGEMGIKVEPIAVRIENLRKLSETTKTLVALERTVLNITPDTPIDPSKRVAEAFDNGIAGLKAKFDQKLGRTA